MKDGVPAVVPGKLASIGGHVVLTVAEDVKQLAIFHPLRMLGQEGRRRRVSTLSHRPASCSARPMTNRTIVCENQCATVTCPLVFQSNWAMEFLSCSQCVLRRRPVMEGHQFARNRARLRSLQGRTTLEV